MTLRKPHIVIQSSVRTGWPDRYMERDVWWVNDLMCSSCQANKSKLKLLLVKPLSVTLTMWKWAIRELEAICCTAAVCGVIHLERHFFGGGVGVGGWGGWGGGLIQTERDFTRNLLSIQRDAIRLLSALYCFALQGFVLVKPGWVTFRVDGPPWHEWRVTAVAMKWKQICGFLRGLRNSTVLWGQISCPLHQSIRDHWSFHRFNLLTGVWLGMIYGALCSICKSQQPCALMN